MNKTVKKSLAGATLSLGLLAGPVSTVHAQQSDSAQQQTENDDGDNGMIGLVGLAGLIGLAGLARRDRHHDSDRGVTRNTERDRMASR
jgi:MYXO-CTERM domain-containing protein